MNGDPCSMASAQSDRKKEQAAYLFFGRWLLRPSSKKVPYISRHGSYTCGSNDINISIRHKREAYRAPRKSARMAFRGGRDVPEDA